MATYLAFALLEMSDSWMAGRLGSTALAALMSGQQVLFVLFAVGFGLFTGVNVCVARAEETQGTASAGRYGWQGIWMAALLSALVSSLYWGVETLFAWTGHELEVRVQEVAFLRVALWSMPFQYLTLALSNFFLAIRKPLQPMRSGMLQVGLNIPCSWFAIFGLDGVFPGMGLVGAAWGTVVASAAGFLVLLADFLGREMHGIYRTRRLAWSWEAGRSIFKIGFPKSVLGFCDVLIWNVALVLYVGRFGTEHLAASAVMYAALMLMLVPGDGMNVAVATVSAHSLAAGKIKLARSKLRRGLCLNLHYMGIVGLLCLNFRSDILSWFSTDPAVIRIGAQLFLLLPVILIADACISVLDGWLAGAGDVDWPTIVTLFVSLALVIGGGWAVQAYLPGLASLGIWLAIACSRVLVAAALIRRWRSGVWRGFQPLP